MAISKGYKANFEQLLAAAKNGDLALLECTDKTTGEMRAVLCAVNRTSSEYQMVPFGHLCPGNPYDMYAPPEA